MREEVRQKTHLMEKAIQEWLEISEEDLRAAGGRNLGKKGTHPFILPERKSIIMKKLIDGHRAVQRGKVFSFSHLPDSFMVSDFPNPHRKCIVDADKLL